MRSGAINVTRYWCVRAACLVLPVCFLGLFSSVALNAKGFYTARYPVGNAPSGIVMADLNRDGKLDLAVTNQADGTVSVLLGNGDGSFRPAVNYGAGTGPHRVVTGDFNGDGYPDLAIANFNSNNISILLGNGDGTFRSAVNYAVAGNPDAIAIGDLNLDGKPDLVVANRSSMTVLLNNGDGSFRTLTAPVGLGPGASIVVADFNRDGKPDVAVAIYNELLILLGNGDGTFQTPRHYATVAATPFLVVADFNSDGSFDLAVGNDNTLQPVITIFLGNGDGTFQPQPAYNLGVPIYWLAVGDVNGDGKQDLVATTPFGPSVRVALGNGDGTFQPAKAYYADGVSVQAALGDINGDGKTDIVVTDFFSAVNVLLGFGDGSFQSPEGSFDVGDGPEGITGGDFNGDGKLDLAVADSNYYGSGSSDVAVLLGNGDGTFQSATKYQAGNGPFGIAAGDFNNDGIIDIAVADRNATAFCSSGQMGGLHILLGNGDGTFQPPNSYASGGCPMSVAVADFNSDGKLDVVVANYLDNNLSLFLGNGDGTFQVPANFATGQTPFSIAVGDFNGDGKPDVVVANGSGSISVLLNNGDGTFQPASNYPAGFSPRSVALGDFKGDGFLDVGLAEVGSDASVSVLLGAGNGTFGPFVKYNGGTNTVSLAVADFDGDGNLDLAVTNNMQPGRVSLLRGNGDGTFSDPVAYITDNYPVALYVGDFNGDGAPDLAVASFGKDTVNILLNSGGVRSSLQSSQNPSLTGRAVTFTATVTPSLIGVGTPGGSVIFYDGSNPLGIATLDSTGKATFSTSALSIGSHSISARYSGDSNFNPKTLAPLQQVVKAASITTLLSSVNPSLVGQSVTFTATVGSSAGVPSGNVGFLDFGNIIGTSALDMSGVASLSTTALTQGPHSMVALYLGDAAHFDSNSAALSQIVKTSSQADTTTTLTVSSNPALSRRPVAFAVQVSGPAGTPTGTVDVLDGQTRICTASLAGALAGCTSNQLTTGKHTITAVYYGDASFAASISSAVVEYRSPRPR